MKTRTNENDLGYIDQFPHPMYEPFIRMSCSTVINHTTPMYGPLLGAWAMAMPAFNILEIGIAQGWTSSALAWAVLGSNNRYGMTGKYYGMDISDKTDLAERMSKAEDINGKVWQLPVEFIQDLRGSVEWLKDQKMFGPNFFDIIFIDGWHNVEYVKKEVALCWPLLKGNGEGYMAHHDIYAYSEPIHKYMTDTYPVEAIRLLNNYGLGIYRKMDGYDHNKVFWPDGDQKESDGWLT